MVEFGEYKRQMMLDDPCITHMIDRGDGTCLIVKRLMFHWTLLLDTIEFTFGYEDRWCYQTQAGALAAAEQWIELGDAMPEPTGWHRHHITGRRRVMGDPAREYIQD